MKVFSIIYDITTRHEKLLQGVDSIEDAVALVKEVVGDHIVFVSLKTTDGFQHGTVVIYEEDMSHESVIKAEGLHEAKKKVLSVFPNAKITNGWEITSSVNIADSQVLMEDKEDPEETKEYIPPDARSYVG